jgi:hypothetical protein
MAGGIRTPTQRSAKQPPRVEDTGDRDHYRNTDNGIECVHALRACLGRDGYIAWLRGQVIKYNWRLGQKPGVDPAEDSIKATWYQTELTRVLSDENA